MGGKMIDPTYDPMYDHGTRDEWSITHTPMTLRAGYPKGWKALSFFQPDKPMGMEWFHFLWGWDIFYGEFPLLKSLVLANALVWVVLWLVR